MLIKIPAKDLIGFAMISRFGCREQLLGPLGYWAWSIGLGALGLEAQIEVSLTFDYPVFFLSRLTFQPVILLLADPCPNFIFYYLLSFSFSDQRESP